MTAVLKLVIIGIYHTRCEYEDYVDPRTGKVPEFGSYQGALAYIAAHGLPANASPVEVFVCV